MFKGEKRKISRDNNQGGEENRPCHFRRTAQDRILRQHFVRMPFALLQHRFHHHDRPVHQDTEVNRS